MKPDQAPRAQTFRHFFFDEAEVGRADALVFCFPGYLNSVSMFDPLRSKLGDRFALVTLRWPGLDGKPGSVQVHAEEMIEEFCTVSQLNTNAKLAIVGYSIGGLWAQFVGTAAGSRGAALIYISAARSLWALLLCGANGILCALRAIWRRKTLNLAEIEDDVTKQLFFGSGCYRKPWDQTSESYEFFKASLPPATWQSFRSQVLPLVWDRRVTAARTVGVETHVIHGSDDPIIRFTLARKRRTNSGRFSVLERTGAGHSLPFADAGIFDEMAKIIRAYR